MEASNGLRWVLALRTFFTRTDVLESLGSRKGAAYAARNTLENRLIGQTDASLSVGGSCQARTVGERLSREPQEARVSSHLERTRSTAQMIARHHAFPAQEGSPWSHEQKCTPRFSQGGQVQPSVNACLTGDQEESKRVREKEKRCPHTSRCRRWHPTSCMQIGSLWPPIVVLSSML